MSCTHLNGRRCTLGLCNGTPAKTCCARCESYSGPPRGAGDVVHKVLQVTYVASAVKKITGGKCGCEERRVKMNELVPFKGGAT
jgi:hypothetical protein